MWGHGYMGGMRGLRVLVVEDEPLVGMMIEDMLGDLGCEVVDIATRIEHALTAIAEKPVDFVILDLNLGGRLTYPVADELTARAIPFIFATGYGAGGLDGAYAGRPILTKPFHQRDLERILPAPRTD